MRAFKRSWWLMIVSTIARVLTRTIVHCYRLSSAIINYHVVWTRRTQTGMANGKMITFAECLVVHSHHPLVGYSIFNSKYLDYNLKCHRVCWPQRALNLFKITRSRFLFLSTFINYHDRLNWVPFDCVERDSNFLSALQTFRAHSELDACTAKARTNYFIT